MQRRWKEWLLNSLLVLLVGSSLLLTSWVWYPGERLFFQDADQPSLQPQPPPADRQMPEVFRPERIQVGRSESRLASLHPGAPAYMQVWRSVRRALDGTDTGSGADLIDEVPDGLTEDPWIHLYLPTSLMVSEWADLWGWHPSALRNGTIWVDQLILSLAQPGAIYLSGPFGSTLYVADLAEERRVDLLQMLGWLEPDLFSDYRRLDWEVLGRGEGPVLLVPQVESWPQAHVTVALPDEKDEEARFFPDLSVIRQIDERDARSLTDGQRVLRITRAGRLEYRTADPSTSTVTPDMARAISLAQEWVGQRGGWPQEIVLRSYSRQPGRTKLEFALRSGGPYPVESITGAVQIHIASQRVVYFARQPSPVAITFDQEQAQPLIAPEEALRRASSHMALGNDPIRSLYLAYVLRPVETDVGSGWELEPAWVIQVAGARIYVFAGPSGEGLSPEVINVS